MIPIQAQSVCVQADNAKQQTVTATMRREVSLFPRHWQWLSDQPRDLSAALRLLVEAASRDMHGIYRAQQLKEECYYLMRDMAGDSADFEDASRALFSDDIGLLKKLAEKWPLDVANNIISLATQACAVAISAQPSRSN